MDSPPPTPRLQSVALVVPLTALLLLMPPLVSLFTGPTHVFAIPLIVLYMFGVWALLVFLTWWLARRLGGAGPEPPA